VGSGRAQVGAILLDTCCSLNLAATGCIDEILGRLPYRFLSGSRAWREAQWLRTPDGEEREPVDLQPLFDGGLLEEAVLESADEEALFVELAALLADGEAEGAALAVHRGYTLATDDRKARRIVAERWPTLRLTSTLELLHEWQVVAAVPEPRIAGALRQVARRATYRPRPNHPLWAWWAALVGEEAER
jgi:hypothetical protein